VNAVWVLERAAAAAPPRLIRDQEKSPTAPRWSADGRWLYFLSSRSGSTQLWRTTASGTDTRQMTSLPLDVAFYRLAPNAPAAVVAVNATPTAIHWPVARPRMTPRRRRKPRECSTTALPRGLGYLPRRPFHRAVRAQSQRRCAAHRRAALTRGYKADIVYKPDGDDSSFAISTDGASVFFAAAPSGSSQGLGDAHSLYRVPLDASTAPRRLDPAAQTYDGGLALSPDGSRLAYLSRKGSIFTAPRARVMIRDVKNGTTHELAPSFDRSPTALAWSADSSTLYAIAEDLGQKRIYALNAQAVHSNH